MGLNIFAAIKKKFVYYEPMIHSLLLPEGEVAWINRIVTLVEGYEKRMNKYEHQLEQLQVEINHLKSVISSSGVKSKYTLCYTTLLI